MKTRALWMVLVLCGLWLCASVGAQDTDVYKIAYSKDGRYLAVKSKQEGEPERLTIYEIQGNQLGAVVLDIGAHDGFYIHPFLWNPVHASQIMLVSSGIISVYDVETRQYVRNLRTGWGYHWQVIWTADGEGIIANGSSDTAGFGEMRLFNDSSEGVEIVDPLYDNSSGSDLIAMAIDPTNTQLIVSRSPSPESYIFDLTNPDQPPVYHERDYDNLVTDFVWTPEVLVLQVNGGESYLFYAPNDYDGPIAAYSGLDAYNDDPFALRPHTTQVAIGHRNGLLLYDWVTQQVVTEIEASIVLSLDWSPDGRTLAYVSDFHLHIEEIPMPSGGTPAPTSTPMPSPTATPEECFASLDSTYDQLLNVLGSMSFRGGGHYTACFYGDFTTITITSDTSLAPLRDFSGPTLTNPVVNDVVIEGNGAVIERANDAAFFRFFAVAPGGHLTLRNMTLRGGLLEEGKGAAILNQGTLTLDNVIFDNNCLVDDPCSDDAAIENDGGTVNIIGPVMYGAFPSPTPSQTPFPSLTPSPTITPIILNALTPVALPTRIATQTPAPTSTP